MFFSDVVCGGGVLLSELHVTCTLHRYVDRYEDRYIDMYIDMYIAATQSRQGAKNTCLKGGGKGERERVDKICAIHSTRASLCRFAQQHS